jgi:hypothetical protein
VTSDNYFIPVNATRKDEAGMVAGAWMGGMKWKPVFRKDMRHARI